MFNEAPLCSAKNKPQAAAVTICAIYFCCRGSPLLYWYTQTSIQTITFSFLWHCKCVQLERILWYQVWNKSFTPTHADSAFPNKWPLRREPTSSRAATTVTEWNGITADVSSTLHSHPTLHFFHDNNTFPSVPLNKDTLVETTSIS